MLKTVLIRNHTKKTFNMYNNEAQQKQQGDVMMITKAADQPTNTLLKKAKIIGIASIIAIISSIVTLGLGGALHMHMNAYNEKHALVGAFLSPSVVILCAIFGIIFWCVGRRWIILTVLVLSVFSAIYACATFVNMAYWSDYSGNKQYNADSTKIASYDEDKAKLYAANTFFHLVNAICCIIIASATCAILCDCYARCCICCDADLQLPESQLAYITPVKDGQPKRTNSLYVQRI